MDADKRDYKMERLKVVLKIVCEQFNVHENGSEVVFICHGFG